MQHGNFWEFSSDNWEEMTTEEWLEKLNGPDSQTITWDEDTEEIKCSCGTWKVYGRDVNPLLHTDWCDLNDKN